MVRGGNFVTASCWFDLLDAQPKLLINGKEVKSQQVNEPS
jgi:hypothetical protein